MENGRDNIYYPLVVKVGDGEVHFFDIPEDLVLQASVHLKWGPNH